MIYVSTSYFCGHHHSLQHINDGTGVNYIVSGAGHLTSLSKKHEVIYLCVPSERVVCVFVCIGVCAFVLL